MRVAQRGQSCPPAPPSPLCPLRDQPEDPASNPYFEARPRTRGGAPWVLRAIERAYELLDTRGTAPVRKSIWGSPAGKKRSADRLVAMLPAHKTHVEPFAGSAAVLFAKERSEVEAINDACLLERDGTSLGLGGPSIVLITGKEKPFKTVLSKADYGDMRRLGDAYRARVPRSVLVRGSG